MLSILLSVAFSAPAHAEEGALAVVPFGVCQFVWGKPGRGITYAGTQALGLTATVVGSVNGNAALEADDEEGMELWQIVAGTGVALWAGSYMVQVIDGSRLAEKRAEARGEVAWALPFLDGDAARQFDLGLHPLAWVDLRPEADLARPDLSLGVRAPPPLLVASAELEAVAP